MPVERRDPQLPEQMVGPEARLRRRDGFALTDSRWNDREVQGEIHYCVLCHERDKDTCSKGITDKQGAVTSNALGIPLAGCPLGSMVIAAVITSCVIVATYVVYRPRERRVAASSATSLAPSSPTPHTPISRPRSARSPR